MGISLEGRVITLEHSMAEHECQIELLAREIRDLRSEMDRRFETVDRRFDTLDRDMADVKSSLKMIIEALAI